MTPTTYPSVYGGREPTKLARFMRGATVIGIFARDMSKTARLARKRMRKLLRIEADDYAAEIEAELMKLTEEIERWEPPSFDDEPTPPRVA